MKKPGCSSKTEKRELRYELSLYITGVSRHSTQAIRNLKEICEKNFSGACHLEIIDLYQHPEISALKQIIAVPTLIRSRPQPEQRFVGDLSKSAEIISKLRR